MHTNGVLKYSELTACVHPVIKTKLSQIEPMFTSKLEQPTISFFSGIKTKLPASYDNLTLLIDTTAIHNQM